MYDENERNQDNSRAALICDRDGLRVEVHRLKAERDTADELCEYALEKGREWQAKCFKYVDALRRISSAPTQLPATVLINVAREALAGKTSQGFHDVDEFYQDDTEGERSISDD